MPGGELIRVVVVDDHEMLLHSIVRVLDAEPDMVVVGSAGTLAKGIDAIAKLAPDVVVMDYHLPDGDGGAASQHIAEAWPSIRVVMLTGSGMSGAVFEAARAG